MASDQDLPDIRIDGDSLYREEQLSDFKAGSIRRLIPVNIDGEEDSSREPRFVGQASLMTQAGALPLSFELDAKDLKGAVEAFPAAARQSLQETIEEMERLRREQASSIMVPGQGQGGGMGAPGGGQAKGPPGFKL